MDVGEEAGKETVRIHTWKLIEQVVCLQGMHTQETAVRLHADALLEVAGGGAARQVELALPQDQDPGQNDRDEVGEEEQERAQRVVPHPGLHRDPYDTQRWNQGHGDGNAGDRTRHPIVHGGVGAGRPCREPSGEAASAVADALAQRWRDRREPYAARRRRRRRQPRARLQDEEWRQEAARRGRQATRKDQHQAEAARPYALATPVTCHTDRDRLF